MKYVIGVDLGTSATKTILVDQNGKIVAEASVKYPMYQPENGWAEQDPSDWSEAAISTIKSVVEKGQVNGKDVRGIGISGQMHGLVMLNEENQVIRRSIIWCDQRATKQVEEMLELPMEKWMKITANPPMAGWTAAKILWIRENEPELFAKCRHIMLPKDYVRFILTGKYATDASDASGMQMLDVKNRCWSQEILDFLKVDRELLGDVYESPEVVGNLLPKIAEKCGLSTETVVVAGGSDNACAAIGTGIVREGQAFTTIGTSTDNYQAGALCAEAMIEDFPDGGEIAVLDYPANNACNDREQGFLDTIEGKGFDVVATFDAEGTVEKGQTITSDIIQANPDIKAIFSINDQAGMGAYAALTTAGKEVYVYGVDGAPEAKKVIAKDNSIYRMTAAQSPITIGKECYKAAKTLIAGEKPEEFEVDVPAFAIDSSNIDEYLDADWQ